jgi:type II secretory pathway pseudopilin PulG
MRNFPATVKPSSDRMFSTGRNLSGKSLGPENFGACMVVLVVLLAFSAQQPVLGQQQHVLAITIQATPPPSLGIYTTLLPIDLSILIHNLSTDDFPGGNATVRITPPSSRYETNIEYTVPKLSPGESTSFAIKGFKPLESGVYTVQFDKYPATSGFSNPVWSISGGFFVIDVEPASTLIEFWSVTAVVAVGLLSIIASIAVPSILGYLRTRRLNARRRVAAYRLLRGILRGIEGRTPLPKKGTRLENAYLTQQELDRTNQIIADYHDVLSNTTAQAWDTTAIKEVSAKMIAGIRTPYNMDLRNFAEDVIARYTADVEN